MGRCKAITKSGGRCKNQASEGSEFCHVASHQPENDFGLSEKQVRFCKMFVSEDFYGNGVQSYIEAYGIDTAKKGAYEGARASSSRLLTDANICGYINHLLDDAGLNDQHVDKQLLKLITQDADFSNKIAAIREYNKLKDRITDRMKLDANIDTNINIKVVPASGS